jgi:hypothetical protein
MAAIGYQTPPIYQLPPNTAQAAPQTPVFHLPPSTASDLNEKTTDAKAEDSLFRSLRTISCDDILKATVLISEALGEYDKGKNKFMSAGLAGHCVDGIGQWPPQKQNKFLAAALKAIARKSLKPRSMRTYLSNAFVKVPLQSGEASILVYFDDPGACKQKIVFTSKLGGLFATTTIPYANYGGLLAALDVAYNHLSKNASAACWANS